MNENYSPCRSLPGSRPAMYAFSGCCQELSNLLQPLLGIAGLVKIHGLIGCRRIGCARRSAAGAGERPAAVSRLAITWRSMRIDILPSEGLILKPAASTSWRTIPHINLTKGHADHTLYFLSPHFCMDLIRESENFPPCRCGCREGKMVATSLNF